MNALTKKKRLKSEREPVKYKNNWQLGYGLCFENKMQNATFDCFTLLRILKGAARRNSCFSPTLGKSSCIKSGWTTILFQNFKLPFSFSQNQTTISWLRKCWKLNSCNVLRWNSHNKGLMSPLLISVSLDTIKSILILPLGS